MLGFDIEDKKLVINEHEAEAVRIIFEMYADGKGYSEIINTLNVNGYKTKKGNPFGKNSLYEILRNEKYKGTYTYNKSSHKTPKGTYNRHSYKNDDEIIRIEHGCPQIVSNEVYERVLQRRIEGQGNCKNHRYRLKYMLSGIVWCGKCGSPMHANRRKKESQLTFRCNRKAQTIKCDAKEINMAYLENYVLDELGRNIFSVKRINDIMGLIEQYNDLENASNTENVNELESKLKEINSHQQNIIHAIEQGLFKEHFSQRLSELKEAEENIKSKLMIANQPKSFKVTKKEVLLLINRFNQMRSEQNFDGLRKIILDFVDRVVITDEKIEVSLKLNFGDVNIKTKTLNKEREKLTEAISKPITKLA